MMYRLKSNHHRTCTIQQAPSVGKREWVTVFFSGDQLHGFIIQMPKFLFDETWEPVPEKRMIETDIRYLGLKVYIEACASDGEAAIINDGFSKRIRILQREHEDEILGCSRVEQ